MTPPQLTHSSVRGRTLKWKINKSTLNEYEKLISPPKPIKWSPYAVKWKTDLTLKSPMQPEPALIVH